MSAAKPLILTGLAVTLLSAAVATWLIMAGPALGMAAVIGVKLAALAVAAGVALAVTGFFLADRDEIERGE